MHWLLLLAVITSTTGARSGQSASQTNQLIENALRQKLGGAQTVRVQSAVGKSGGFDRLTVDLSGFAADRLEGLGNSTTPSSGDYFPGGDENIYPPGFAAKKLTGEEIGEILGGVLGGGRNSGDIGGVLSGFLNGGRIGRLQLRANNFSYGGANYDSLSADLGEIRFDWAKALRGQMDIKSVQPGQLFLQLRGDQAAKLLAPRLPTLSDVRVSFRDGRAFVGAKTNTYGLKVPFEVGARLSVQRNKVIAQDFRASVASLRLPGLVLDELTRGVNPLYDFDPQNRWPIAVDLQTAGTTNNALGLRGGVRWLGLNRRNEPTYDDSSRKEPVYAPEPPRSRQPDIFDIFRGR
ncbi:MAG TPA: LmeA family phospholipid-binding protein [Abditibacteriaceae bacterium]|jgi:hypothetical protein